MRALNLFRTTVVASLLALATATAVMAESAQAKTTVANDTLSVTLLGTGVPFPSAKRFSMSTLVQAGSTNLLFDAGRGALIRLWQLGLSSGNLDAVFITHMHSDHTVGLPDLLMSGWVANTYYAKKGTPKDQPMTIYGPGAIEGRIGISESMKYLRQAYSADGYIRENDNKMPAGGWEVDAHDIPNGFEGKVYEKNGVTVTAFPVHHGDWAAPAFGYRVDYQGKSIVISGDTDYNIKAPIMTLGKNVDVLIHEVFMGGPEYLGTKIGDAVLKHHVTPEQAGDLFTQLKPRLAVYSHIALEAFEEAKRPTIEDLTKQTRAHYHGPLLVGEDLTRIDVGAKDIHVTAPQLRLLPIAQPSAGHVDY